MKLHSVVLLSFGLITSSFLHSANAQTEYQFERENSGEVLAILRLSSLPATHNEILSLSFTPAGEALYGFGPNYAGAFDTTDDRGDSVTVADNGSGELLCIDCNQVQQVSFIDNDPPPATGGFPDAIFSINLFDDVSTLTRNGTPFRAAGNWVIAVPEPSSMSVCIGLALMAIGVRTARYEVGR